MNSADVQDSVATEVNDRLSKATQELANKYSKGNVSVEDSVNAPTGNAYKAKYAKEDHAKKLKNKQNKENSNEQEQSRITNNDSDNEDEEEDNHEDDNELRLIKEARLKQIKAQHKQKLENIGKGHGQYREITQDEFIQEVTVSFKVICHFYHRDFQKCDIMNMHLAKLAQRHIEAKFIKIDAEKSPFFVEKLKIRTMPTVVVFHDGVAVDKIIGFEGLADHMTEGQEDSWPTILLSRLLADKKAINSATIIDDDEVEATLKAKMMDIRKAAFVNTYDDDDDELLFDD